MKQSSKKSVPELRTVGSGNKEKSMNIYAFLKILSEFFVFFKAINTTRSQSQIESIFLKNYFYCSSMFSQIKNETL